MLYQSALFLIVIKFISYMRGDERLLVRLLKYV